jgi:SAM-dependent methyltransferase
MSPTNKYLHFLTNFNNFNKSMKCKVCDSTIIKFFSMEQMPLVNSFLKKEEIINEEKFDLSVGFCPKCYLVQLINTVSPEKLFRDYIYFSSTSKFFLEHCQEIAAQLTKKLKLDSTSLVVEIASNDGSQLQFFKDLGIKILGIDPAENIAKIANEKNIPTIPDFFNYKFAKTLKENKNVQADLIFGANVLAHVPEIVDFVKGVKMILKPKGTAVFEFPYLKGLLEKKFDTIYHEHVFYYSLIALRNLFQKADLEIYDVELTPMQGGSLKIFTSHPGIFTINDNVKNLINQELLAGFDKITIYQKMNDDVKNLKNELLSLLDKLKSDGKKIAAYSAPAKGNILLNYFGINENYIDFIVDKSEAKQGLYTPGTHLMVYPLDKLYEKRPDYLLVLCWNIADEVVKQLQGYHDTGGKFIIPIPSIKII